MKKGYLAILLILLLPIILTPVGIVSSQQGDLEGLPEEPKVVPGDIYHFPDGVPEGFDPQGGEITIDLSSAPATFNPALGFDSSSNAVNSLLHSTILEIAFLSNGEITLEPGLAFFEISYDPETREPTKITLCPRRGLKFSNGKDLTADDILFTLKEVVLNKELNPRQELWEVDGEVPDLSLEGDCVVLKTKRIAPKILGNLANQVVFPHDSTVFPVGDVPFDEIWGVKTASEHPENIIGTGPFRLVSYKIGQRIELERNPYYWKVDSRGRQLPYLDKIIIDIIPDPLQRKIHFISGVIVIYRPTPDDLAYLGGELSRLGLDPQRAIDVPDAAPTIGDSVFTFNQCAENQALRAVFRNVEFRRAMSYAVDRQTIIRNYWKGLAEPRCSPGVARYFWVGDEILQELPWCQFDLEKAARILDELGLVNTDPANDGTRNITDVFLSNAGLCSKDDPDTPQNEQKIDCEKKFGQEEDRELEFELLITQGAEISTKEAELFSKDLSTIGVNAKIHPVSLTIMALKLLSSKYEAARINLGGGGDPNFISDVYSSCGALHIYRFCDCPSPEESWQRDADELFDEQANIIYPEDRREKVAELQWLIARNVPFVWTVNGHELCAYRYDKIANFRCPFLYLDMTIKNIDVIYRK